MESQFLFTDVGLTYPIIVFPLGDLSEKAKSIYKIFDHLSLKCVIDASTNQELKQLCATKNVFLPNEINAKVFVVNSESEYLIVRNRFQLESSIPFLNWFLTINFIDGLINNDFEKIKKNAKFLSFSTFDCNFFLLTSKTENNENDLSLLQNDCTFLYCLDDQLNFHSMTKDIQSKFVSFLCPLILKSLNRNVSSIVNFDSTSKSFNRRHSISSQAVSIIQRSALSFLSVNLIDKVHAFTDSLKTLENSKSNEYQKYGALFEMLGLVEEEVPGTIKKSQLPDHAINCGPYWIFEDKNDAVTAYSVAATLFWNAKLPSKTLDCGYHILNYFCKYQIGGQYPLFVLKECRSLIASLSNEDIMESRAFELIVLAYRLGLLRRIPLLIYQLSQLFKTDFQVDFLFMTLNFLYMQSQKQEGNLFILQLATPIVDTLLLSDIYPVEKCRLIFRLLSSIGPALCRNAQEHLFMRLIGITIGDLRIPCNLGFTSQSASVIRPSYDIVPISKQNDQKEKSIFLYNALNANTKTVSDLITVGVGMQFRIEFSLYNPFALDLPVIVSARSIPNCISDDYPLPLKSKSNNSLFCCLSPTKEGDIVIDSIDCVFYQGLQRVSLPTPLHVKAVDGIVTFSVRSEFPLKQTIDLYDGETYNVKLWITNSGSLPITSLVLNFPMKSIESTYNKDGIPSILKPSEIAEINLSFKIRIPADEIAVDILAQSESNKSMQIVWHIRQPINVKKCICISGISSLKYIPEVNMDISRLVFVSIDVTNHSSDTFQYKVSFTPTIKNPPMAHDNDILSHTSLNETSLENFPIIISSKEVRGVLIGHETTSLIVAIPKSILINPPIKAPAERKIQAARKAQVADANFKGKDRAKLDLRVDSAFFIEKSLNFEWFYGSTRSGVLMSDNALPSKDLMKEVRMKRPSLTCSFHYFDDIARYLNLSNNEGRSNSNTNLLGKSPFSYLATATNSKSVSCFKLQQNNDESQSTTESIQTSSSNTFDINDGVLQSLDNIGIKKNVLLSVCFGNVKIRRCKLDLGIFIDANYGIMWNGLLDQIVKEDHLKDPNNQNRFDFILYFSKKGIFNFRILYETEESVKGHFPVEVNVVQT